MKPTFQVKSFETSVNLIDDTDRVVEGYFSKFDNVDLDGDIIVKGAFSKTILERGPKGKNQIKFLNQHNVYQPLGPILELEEDSFGLKYKAKISNTSYGNDVYELIKDGSLNQHSVGFVTLRSKKGENGYNIISEIKLYEGSVVTFAANPDTPVTSVKSFDDLYSELDKIEYILRKGGIKDFTLLEIKLKQLQQLIVELSPVEEGQPVNTTEDPVDTSKEAVELIEVFKERLTFLK